MPEVTGMTHVEAKILEFVARLYPDPFATLTQFSLDHKQFMAESIHTFDRQIQFYMAYLDFISDLKRQDLPFCYPQLSATSETIHALDSFDLMLARSLRQGDESIVLNSFSLQGPERIIVVTGPNQGGKTTFARMFGQLHYLASLGCPIPGRKAQLLLFDQILTHFEREEDIRNLHGKLEDDLLRIHDVLSQATGNSILILNEIFTSTSLQDALFLSKEILSRVITLDAYCVWVTFFDELSYWHEKTLSMVATVEPEDPAIRTFQIVRNPAEGLAYAHAIARKHLLTCEDIKERIPF